MRVSDLVILPSSHLTRPIDVSGYLIVSSHLVCVVDDASTARSGLPHFGILVNRDAIEALNTIDVPHMGGSSVSITGNISLRGTATPTGIPGFPLYIPYIYDFAFSNGHGSWEFHIGEPFKNIYLLSPPSVAPRSIALLKPLFDSTFTVIRLKQLLESAPEHCVGRHLRGDDFSRVVETIAAAGLTWRSEECDISRGEP